MKVPFNPKNEITCSEDLFGVEILFNQLAVVANRKSNAQIIGLRRFGKTSLLKSLNTFLKSDSESKVYPLYLDFKEVGSIVKGTSNVYRYSIAILVTHLTRDGIFSGSEIFRNQDLNSSHIWEDTYIALQDVNDIRIPGLFEEIVTFFADLLEKTILFLFDEYEYLFKYTFDDPVGFMKLRNFTSKITEKGLNPFTFFVSGGHSWEHLCSITGSPELNCIDQTLFVAPIDKESFQKMWDFECNLMENCPVAVKSGSSYSYKASGGIPFYGKVIGSYWYTTGIKPTYKILKSHIQEVYNSLESEQKDILIEINSRKKLRVKTPFLFDLLDKGLVKHLVNGDYIIAIGFLKDYLDSITEEKIKKYNHGFRKNY